MNVEQAVMQVDYWKAHSAYLEYRALVKSGRATKQDAELRRAYREIYLGKKVLDINMAIGDAGLDAQGLPKLAIARADWAFVHAWMYDGRFVFSAGGSWESNRKQTATHNVNVRIAGATRNAEGKAQVPMIPPAHRPPSASPLSGYRILFEAVWERRPPVDPILLKAIGGPFYVVLAQWDLSPLEQAVLRAKL